MRKIFAAIIALTFLNTVSFGQDQFQVFSERKDEKTFKGIISRKVLESDTFFHWYAENQKAYSPNSVALAAFKQYKDSVQILCFMGTWCEDSQFIIPKFFMLTDAAGFSNDRITLVGVDRKKQTLSHLSEALNITNVPTIIVLKDGKELGRVIEYGKYGMWDKELGDIINAAFSK